MPWPGRLLHRVPDAHGRRRGRAARTARGRAARARPRPRSRLGGRVGVYGCGPLGLLLIQLLRLAGASDRSSPRIAWRTGSRRRGHGRHATASSSATAGAWTSRAADRDARDEPVDVAFEVAGDDDALSDAIAAVRPGGRVVLVGIPDGDRTSFPAGAARRKELTLQLARRMAADRPAARDRARRGRRRRPGLPDHVIATRSLRRRRAFATLAARVAASRSSSPRPRALRRGSDDDRAAATPSASTSGPSRRGRCSSTSRTAASTASRSIPYRNGVIDDRLPDPDRDVVLGPDWALQDPNDYLETFRQAVRRLVAGAADRSRARSSGSASTSPPARCSRRRPTARRCASSMRYRREPHAWVKLWKHHAAQPEADDVNRVAARARPAVAGPLRRQDLVRVVLPEGAPDPARGARTSTAPPTASSRPPTGSSGS